jgi:hypothetical protein
MLSKARAPSPRKITRHASPGPFTTTTRSLKTYRRRPRSDASQSSASAVLHPLSQPLTRPSAGRELEARGEAHPSRDKSSMFSESVPPELVVELVLGSRPPWKTCQNGLGFNPQSSWLASTGFRCRSQPCWRRHPLPPPRELAEVAGSPSRP